MRGPTEPSGNAPPREPEGLPGERTAFVQSGELLLRVREWGNPEAPAILALHGLRGFSGTWRGLARALGEGYRVIGVDQRGRGESSWDHEVNYYTEAYLADLEATVTELGLGRFVLLGHSMGGTTAYAYAARHPDRLVALIIEDIAPGSSVAGAGAERIKAEMADLPLEFASWAEARDYWRRTRPQVSQAALEQRLWETLREVDEGRIAWRYDAKGISRARLNPDPSRVIDLWPIVDAVRTPSLVIRGMNSDFCPLETVLEMESRNPYFTHASVEDASHYIHDDQPVAFHALIEGFLCGVRSTRRPPFSTSSE